VVTTPSDVHNFWNISAKLDHKLSAANQISGRYSYAHEFINDPFGVETGNGNNIPQFGQYVPRYRTNAGITLTSILSARSVNEFRASYNHFIQPQAPYYSTLESLVGRTPDPLPPAIAAIPRQLQAFDLFNLSGAYANLGGTAGFLRNTKYFMLSDGLTLTSGKHTFKFGGDARRMRFDNITGSPNTYAFDGRYTGNTFADFILGTPFSTTTVQGPGPGIPARTFGMDRKFEWSGYVQDDWKASARFTLNLGLRYEYYRPITEANGLAGWDKQLNKVRVICEHNREVECGIPFLDPNLYIVQFADQSLSPTLGGPAGTSLYPIGLWYPDRNNFAPRFGLTFRPFSNKTVFRAGYGIYFDSDDRTKSSSAKTAPFTVSKTYTSDPKIPQIQLGSNPFPTNLGIQPTLSLTAYDINRRDTYAQRWNLGIQQELPGRLMFDAEYQGTLTVKGSLSRQINQPLAPGPGNANLRRPYAGFGSISYIAKTADWRISIRFRLRSRSVSRTISHFFPLCYGAKLLTIDS